MASKTRFLITWCFFVSSFFGFALPATLPTQEVEALRIIGSTLKKTTWNFSVNPCDVAWNVGGWRNSNAIEGSEDAITCDCSFLNGSVCHVRSIVLKSQDLQGSLPRELVDLHYLQEINLARNYLSGSIPPEWGALPLVNITLRGNRLTGPIPKEIGSITTLESLVLDNNQLSGTLPPELGGLANMQRLFLSSNKFKGKIPSSFSKLTSMRIFRISDNRFRETIPAFIENWKQLETLVIHASGLSGPIPPSISRLAKLKDLMISDLSGPESSFPPLENLTKMRNLVLRNINLTGELPSYLGTNTTNLRLLDLSFNKLRGEIPSSYEELRDVENIYLTGNMLNGSIPSWMPKERDGDIIDLSYNKFSEDLTTEKCVAQHMDQFAGAYTIANNSLSVFCLKSYECPKTSRGLHINCGGEEVKINGTTYEADNYDRQPLFYENSLNGWVMSNTGHFLDGTINSTTWSYSSKVSGATDPRLYANARLSAISLTYYAMCLQSGEYKVNLHFAEIMFSGTRSYKSLGRRYFDIYIQERLVLKDFNIADDAGGVGKATVKTFPVTISEGNLQIRLYWAGKGTVDTPVKGVYGPLISAISVDPDFDPAPKNASGTTISVGVIIGIIAVGVTVFVMLVICGVVWWFGCLRTKSQIERDFKKMDVNINAFSLRQIKDATDDFAPANKIGQGGFGPVYKGMMSNGTEIAVKQLSEASHQGNREFLNEIGVISALQHPALVKLHGCCVEGGQLLVVYEYLENNSLSRALFGPQATQISLDWPTRQKICLGTARGLAYIHEESRLKILHRDIKAANILLDKDLNPKISDFGLANLDTEDQSHISTRPCGTYGYIAPEYATKGHLSHKSDVYSFGVVAMEVVYGKSNSSTDRPDSEDMYFTEWVRLLWKQNKLAELVDPRLRSYDMDQVVRLIEVAILCTSRSPADRPSMSAVVSMLEGQLTADIETQLASTRDEPTYEPLDIMAEIFTRFESDELSTILEAPETSESPETLGQRSLLRGKGKEKVSSDSFSFRAESSRTGEERERR